MATSSASSTASSVLLRRPVPCSNCRVLRKKCDLLKPKCTRCMKRGATCNYAPSSSLSPLSSHLDTAMPDFVENPVEHPIPSLENSLNILLCQPLPATESFSSLSLLGMLLPSQTTFPLGWHPPNGQHHSALRLALGGIISYMNSDFHLHTFRYYYLSRRSLVCIDAPCLPSLQATHLNAQICFMRGLISSCKFLFRKCESLCLCLQMTTDPDNISSCRLLTVQERIERRRTFWVTDAFTKIVKLCDGNTSEGLVKPTVKPFHFFIGNSAVPAPCVFLNRLLDMISRILDFFRIPPETLQDLFQAPSALQMKVLLSNFYYSIPPSLRIDLFSEKREVPFHDHGSYSCTVILNLFHNATHCYIHRPYMYVSSEETPESLSLRCLDYSKEVTKSLLTCVTHASHISAINTLLLQNGCFGQDVLAYFLVYIPIFEAAVTLWFLTCRTLPAWWTFLERSEATTIISVDDSDKYTSLHAVSTYLSNAVSNVKDIISTLEKLDAAASLPTAEIAVNAPYSAWNITTTVIRPLLETVRAMLEEMNMHSKACTDDSFIEHHTVISMQCFETGRQVYPRVFLGLMGAEVLSPRGARLSWNSENEAEWELFWAKMKWNA